MIDHCSLAHSLTSSHMMQCPSAQSVSQSFSVSGRSSDRAMRVITHHEQSSAAQRSGRYPDSPLPAHTAAAGLYWGMHVCVCPPSYTPHPTLMLYIICVYRSSTTHLCCMSHHDRHHSMQHHALRTLLLLSTKTNSDVYFSSSVSNISHNMMSTKRKN